MLFLLRLAYLTMTNTFAVLRLLSMGDRGKDTEIVALRHQIAVLERQLGKEKVRFTPSDRVFHATHRGHHHRAPSFTASRTALWRRENASTVARSSCRPVNAGRGGDQRFPQPVLRRRGWPAPHHAGHDGTAGGPVPARSGPPVGNRRSDDRRPLPRLLARLAGRLHPPLATGSKE